MAPVSPGTLAELGYGFNDRGEIRKIDDETGETTDEPFQFDVRPSDKDYNQSHYEEIGAAVTEFVYTLLVNDCGLERYSLEPELDGDSESFVFFSNDWQSREKLLVLIHGSGAVRAGQWSRRLIINEGLDEGSQLPYIKEARDNGYGVIVMNTNQNSYTGGKVKIPGSETPLGHGATP